MSSEQTLVVTSLEGMGEGTLDEALQQIGNVDVTYIVFDETLWTVPYQTFVKIVFYFPLILPAQRTKVVIGNTNPAHKVYLEPFGDDISIIEAANEIDMTFRNIIFANPQGDSFGVISFRTAAPKKLTLHNCAIVNARSSSSSAFIYCDEDAKNNVEINCTNCIFHLSPQQEVAQTEGFVVPAGVNVFKHNTIIVSTQASNVLTNDDSKAINCLYSKYGGVSETWLGRNAVCSEDNIELLEEQLDDEGDLKGFCGALKTSKKKCAKDPKATADFWGRRRGELCDYGAIEGTYVYASQLQEAKVDFLDFIGVVIDVASNTTFDLHPQFLYWLYNLQGVVKNIYTKPEAALVERVNVKSGVLHFFTKLPAEEYNSLDAYFWPAQPTEVGTLYVEGWQVRSSDGRVGQRLNIKFPKDTFIAVDQRAFGGVFYSGTFALPNKAYSYYAASPNQIRVYLSAGMDYLTIYPDVLPLCNESGESFSIALANLKENTYVAEYGTGTHLKLTNSFLPVSISHCLIAIDETVKGITGIPIDKEDRKGLRFISQNSNVNFRCIKYTADTGESITYETLVEDGVFGDVLDKWKSKGWTLPSWLLPRWVSL